MANGESLINPFTPSFGEVPLFMPGRELIIDEMNRGFAIESR